ncbi:MAG TPA: hypothetical protein VGX25_05590 [Actinophytocola sp.]|uniref:WXG100 family type VII secretion target n=1 Tax=Actinophytocola sp. TaxID=1872138 RepID=UPI002DDCF9CF|nr:hypothetical protein [Actinophytocola sp.]HEV2778856.1 hypothetical protein [Actinophytocola sp.]
MTTAPAALGAEAARDADDAATLLATISGRDWIAAGLRADGNLQALSTPMRPIDALSSAGLDALKPHVQPLQEVLDRMAGNASVIQSFADGWQRAATRVGEVHQRLGGAARTDTAEWTGEAADRYRDRAAEVTESLRAAAAMCSVLSEAGRTMGEVVAGARSTVNDLLTDLVGRLISYTRQAMAAEGGLTPNVMAQATQMINSYRAPIADVERQVQQTIENLKPKLDGQFQVAWIGPAIRIGLFVLAVLGRVLERLLRRRRPSNPRRDPQRERDWERAERDRREREERLRRLLEEQYRQEYERGRDYRRQCEAIYGPPPADGRDYQAHHNFPVEFHAQFRRVGIDTSDPKWCSWVETNQHRGMSAEYARDWQSFFDNNPGYTREQTLDFAREMGRKYGYDLPWSNLPWAR